MRRLQIVCALLINFAFVFAAQSDAAEEGFTDLFNGKDLTGWDFVLTEDSEMKGESIFTVHDGMIHVYQGVEDGSKVPFAGIITTENYSNYHLVVEYKWGESKFHPRYESVRDAGIVFHVVGTPKIWPHGIECQIQEGDTGDIWILGETRTSSPVQSIAYNYDKRGDLQTRGSGMYPRRFARGHCWEVPGWNRVDVIVKEDHAVFKVNGHVVNEAIRMRYREDPETLWAWDPLTEGKIFLQAEGAELFYRNVSIKPLD